MSRDPYVSVAYHEYSLLRRIGNNEMHLCAREVYHVDYQYIATVGSRVLVVVLLLLLQPISISIFEAEVV